MESFHIDYVSNLLKSNNTNTINNYIIGGIVGGGLCSLFFIINSPSLIGIVTFHKLLTTIGCIGIGSYTMDIYGTNYYKELSINK